MTRATTRIAVTRRADWEGARADYLAASAALPFKWGAHDCALFAAGAVLAMTGHDVAAPYRGRYRSVAGSVRALRRFGAGTLESTVDALFGACPPGFARRGDLVMFSGSLGVCIGNDALFVTETQDAAGRMVGQGLERIARADWDKAWRVG